MAQTAKETESKPPDAAPKFDFSGAISRLDARQFERLKKLMDIEGKRRRNNEASVGEMSNSDFDRWATEQVTKSEQAMRESWLRDELGSKSKSGKVRDNGK